MNLSEVARRVMGRTITEMRWRNRQHAEDDAIDFITFDNGDVLRFRVGRFGGVTAVVEPAHPDEDPT